MKIAVCLSGQPRSVKHTRDSILNYFSSYDVDYFCHAWDYNTWKLLGHRTEWEPVDVDRLHEELRKFYPKYTPEVESIDDLPKRFGYSSMLYSQMRANLMKCGYELEHNFRYDYVFKCRYDSVFDFDSYPILGKGPGPERTVNVSFIERMDIEHNRLNASDVFYYGDSWGMDIMSDLYRYMGNIKADSPDNFCFFGPGTMIPEYAAKFGVKLVVDPQIEDTIFRKEAIGLSAMDDFSKIREIHRSFYA